MLTRSRWSVCNSAFVPVMPVRARHAHASFLKRGAMQSLESLFKLASLCEKFSNVYIFSKEGRGEEAERWGKLQIKQKNDLACYL